ncbi:unnamed protein product, partial [marine sediment metagenome]
MSNDLSESFPTKSELAPSFAADLINTSLSLFIVIVIWYTFLQVVYPFLYFTLDLIGLIAAML